MPSLRTSRKKVRNRNLSVPSEYTDVVPQIARNKVRAGIANGTVVLVSVAASSKSGEILR